MRVYHGSDVKIDKIDLSRSEYFKDFGRGFYVTNIREHAHQRAVDIAGNRGTDKPIVTEFNYEEQYPVTVGMRIKKFEKPCKEWVDFIILNRNRRISHPAHTFDIVEGPIADDRMILQIRRYEEGRISIEKLIEKLTYREPTHQICFCTLESLYALTPVEDSEFCYTVDDIAEAVLDAVVVNLKMPESAAVKLFYGSQTFGRLSNADTLLWQKSWQDIYEMFREEVSREKLKK